MQRTVLAAFTVASLCLGSCHKRLPPLVEGATSQGGTNYDCRGGTDPRSQSRLARSPEMVARLRNQFPTGSGSDKLRASLERQGFTLEGPCSLDRGVSWAQFRRNGNEAVANVYWRETPDGRLIWTFADVAYTFL